MRISYSALDTFTTCPAKYKFQYVKQIKAPKSKEAIFGTLIHECLRLFHEPARLAPSSQEDLLKYFTEKWDSSIYQDSQEESFAFHKGVEILKNYQDQNQGKNFNIVNLETRFEVPVSENGIKTPNKKPEPHQITGRIDRIDKLDDGTFEVIDYKTSKKMPPQEKIDNDLQLSIYYLGLLNRWPSLSKQKRPVKLSLYYLVHGEKLSTIRTSQQADQDKERIISLINEIKESDFSPRLNPLCDWCSYKKQCPLWKHQFIKEESPAPDEQEIQKVIHEYFKIKENQNKETKRLNELKEAINKYCDSQGVERVFSQVGYISRTPQQRFSYNFKQVKEILKPIGKWDEILTINPTKFKKVINSLPPHLKKQIEQTKTLEREFKVIFAKKN